MNPKRRAAILLLVIVLAGGLAITCALVMRGFSGRIRDTHLHTIDIALGQLLASGQAWVAANPGACGDLKPGEEILLGVEELVPPAVSATLTIRRSDPEGRLIMTAALTHGVSRAQRAIPVLTSRSGTSSADAGENLEGP